MSFTKEWIIISFILFISGCDNPGINFEKELYETSDGLVRYKTDNTVFTGEFYFATCEECSEPLLNIWPVHYAGHYKNGKKDGVFWLPKSGRSNDHFDYSERNSQKIIIYENGKIVNPNHNN